MVLGREQGSNVQADDDDFLLASKLQMCASRENSQLNP
jgi:hypothetical protein